MVFRPPDLPQGALWWAWGKALKFQDPPGALSTDGPGKDPSPARGGRRPGTSRRFLSDGSGCFSSLGHKRGRWAGSRRNRADPGGFQFHTSPGEAQLGTPSRPPAAQLSADQVFWELPPGCPARWRAASRGEDLGTGSDRLTILLGGLPLPGCWPTAWAKHLGQMSRLCPPSLPLALPPSPGNCVPTGRRTAAPVGDQTAEELGSRARGLCPVSFFMCFHSPWLEGQTQKGHGLDVARDPARGHARPGRPLCLCRAPVCCAPLFRAPPKGTGPEPGHLGIGGHLFSSIMTAPAGNQLGR